MKLAEQIITSLEEGFSMTKRLNLIRNDISDKNISIRDLLHHLSGLETMADKGPKELKQIKLLIKQVESKLKRK